MNINITDENFEEELKKQEKFVLVDFFATWCGPCQIIGPLLEKIIENNEFKDKIFLAKIDVDKFPQTSQKYGIDRIPAVYLFKNGKVVKNFTGLVPEQSIKEWLRNAIENNK